MVSIRNFAVLISFLLSLTACDKNESDPGPQYTEEDYARCAHIEQGGIWGDIIYNSCLCCPDPYPTDVTPGPPTQDGGHPVEGLPNSLQGIFTGWINDTIAFRSWGPRSLPDEWAKAKLAYEAGGQPSAYRLLLGGWGTWDEITNKGVSIVLRSFSNGRLKSYAINRSWLQLTDFGDLSGRYAVDSVATNIEITRWDSDVVSGTIDAWFYDPDDPTRRVHFSDGWFDVGVKP